MAQTVKHEINDPAAIEDASKIFKKTQTLLSKDVIGRMVEGGVNTKTGKHVLLLGIIHPDKSGDGLSRIRFEMELDEAAEFAQAIMAAKTKAEAHAGIAPVEGQPKEKVSDADLLARVEKITAELRSLMDAASKL